MAETLKVLAQSAPAATTLTDVYTTPSLTSTTVSTLTVCNRGATAATFRISVAVMEQQIQLLSIFSMISH